MFKEFFIDTPSVMFKDIDPNEDKGFFNSVKRISKGLAKVSLGLFMAPFSLTGFGLGFLALLGGEPGNDNFALRFIGTSLSISLIPIFAGLKDLFVGALPMKALDYMSNLSQKIVEGLNRSGKINQEVFTKEINNKNEYNKDSNTRKAKTIASEAKVNSDLFTEIKADAVTAPTITSTDKKDSSKKDILR